MSAQGVARAPFGKTDAGERVTRYTLTNRRGSRACWIDWGATLVALWIPDRAGALADVVLGFDTFDSYAQNEPFFGCTVGRVANRIAGARFELDGVVYPLAANDGANHLHGGIRGFDKALWAARELDVEAGPALRFDHVSPAGDEGYPGTVRVGVSVVLGHDDALRIEYEATSDAATPVNLTNHSYWNLAGSGDILAHELQLDADRYCEVGADLLPSGRVLPVAGTPFDFTTRKPVGRDIQALVPGYDHNFVLADARRLQPARAGVLLDPVSGRRMTLSTSEPGVQLYSGNFLDRVPGKRASLYGRHAGLCLETQLFPDAVHQPAFPSVVLRPGETYRQTTLYAFDTV